MEHFQKILQSTDVPYQDMLFFDDEDRNIRSVCVYVVFACIMFIVCSVTLNPKPGSESRFRSWVRRVYW